MNRAFYLFILILGILFNSCNPEKSFFERENEARTEVFTLTTGIDTVLQTLEGVEIIISKSSFVNPPTQLDLQVRTVLDRYSMLSEGTVTMTTEGKLLESDGMIFIQSSPTTQINPQAPINIKIPQKSLASDMKIFKGIPKDGLVLWEESGELLKNESLQAIERGEKIFDQNCSVCHSKNLRESLSGPPLGNVTLHRATSFLYEFTRNSPELIFIKNDQLAICVWEYNNKAAMNAYPSFSDDELADIYTYIESESRNQEIGREEIFYVSNCVEEGEQVYFSDADGQIRDSMEIVITDTSSLIQLARSRDMGYKGRVPQFYEFNIFEMGWANLDFFAGTKAGEIENFKIEIPGKKPDEILVFLVFEDRNIILYMKYSKGFYSLIYGAGKELIQFPEQEKLKIYAFGKETDESIEFGTLSVTSQKSNNVYKMDMSPTDIKVVRQRVNQK